LCRARELVVRELVAQELVVQELVARELSFVQSVCFAVDWELPGKSLFEFCIFPGEFLVA
jgi:hypothetical protein